MTEEALPQVVTIRGAEAEAVYEAFRNSIETLLDTNDLNFLEVVFGALVYAACASTIANAGNTEDARRMVDRLLPNAFRQVPNFVREDGTQIQ